MSSIESILSIARSAIVTQQTAMQVVSQNISNASTQGYSRQTAQIVATVPQNMPYGSVGTGVTIDGVTRSRDALLDQGFRQQSSTAEGASVRSDTLSAIQQIFNEPSDTAFAASLDAFWSSWSDLANDPASATAQGIVQQRGESAANLLNGYATQLDAARNQAVQQLTGSVQSLNALSTQVASLNKEITAADSGGGQSPDLLDARDRLLDQMAAIAPVQVIAGANGRVAVTLGGSTIVDGSDSRTVSVTGTPLAPSVTVAGDSAPLANLGGKIGALTDLVNGDIAKLRSSLDGIAKALVNSVNTIHETGYTAAGDALGGANWNPAAGPTGSRVDFFDPSGTTAATIAVSSAVKTNSAVIAAGATSGATGDNSVATAIAALRDRTGAVALRAQMGSAAYDAQVGLAGSTSLGEQYAGVVSDLGENVATAGSNFSVFDTLRQQADTRRTSVSGVSLDEELTQLMAHQTAYAAAAKLVTAADQMAQSILAMIVP